ncbi:CAP domain-containing protein [uncultured Succiniclasticum sp.]
MVAQCMRLPRHRANILNKDFKELGVGYCRKEGTEFTHYWIQMFRG